MLRILRSSSRSNVPLSFSCNDRRGSVSRIGSMTFRKRLKSTASVMTSHYEEGGPKQHVVDEIRRLTHFRNVGILAHVDAGKTTVTERMLALAGVVREAGSVDDGNTVTDYLPAERERGITIQSAAISFVWGWHNSYTGNDYVPNDNVTIHLIDTPGHVDFSVEVNRSVAVLDGAVLVVDAVAGVQAQTETVWRAMTRPSLNNHDPMATLSASLTQDHAHEPLPCLAFINKMDKDGCHFGQAVASLKNKLQGCNPIPIQIPLFRNKSGPPYTSLLLDPSLRAVGVDEASPIGDFVGVVDLVHMRAIVYPEVLSKQKQFSVEDCVPEVFPLMHAVVSEPIDPHCQITEVAMAAREDMIAALANVDEAMGDFFLNEEEPTNAEIRTALRRTTLAKTALPVMAGAALRGKGVEPLLDCVADLLPSPLDRMPPAISYLDHGASVQGGGSSSKKKKKGKNKKKVSEVVETAPGSSVKTQDSSNAMDAIGHPLNRTLLALAFKVVHMKGRGGGDGRVVFVRVYSGELHDRDQVKVITPPAPGELPSKPRKERLSGMLELAGGKFHTLKDGVCESGGVCALVGLKSVVTGDTLMLGGGKGNKQSRGKNASLCLAGVASPKPVLTVRLEAESMEQQTKLSEILALMAIEDPSLLVEETESATLLSGLGELHIEVTLDRLHRDHGIEVRVGKPSVAYREGLTERIQTNGLLNYDRTIGNTRIQAAVEVVLEPTNTSCEAGTACLLLAEPTVTIGPQALEFLGIPDDLNGDDHELEHFELAQALILGCQGALRRGPMGSYPMANLNCHVVNVSAEGGLASLEEMPGALRAGAAHAISSTLMDRKEESCSLLEPAMSVEVSCPSDLLGTVMTDLTGRRGSVGEVLMGDGTETNTKALIRGEVPLVEILGYANGLRSLTGGEGAFTAEYKGHMPCDNPTAALKRR